jgi:hypothetical protein
VSAKLDAALPFIIDPSSKIIKPGGIIDYSRLTKLQRERLLAEATHEFRSKNLEMD